MEIISDTIDENGQRHVVARYTDAEKTAMKARADAHKAERKKLTEG